eukprot:m.108397 g.108397  ORF g.108397 m.108397 type:complete len:98 (+) comp27873_c0_seq1:1159-1452(+)
MLFQVKSTNIVPEIFPLMSPFLFSSQFSARISIFQGITADDVSFICHKHFYVLAIDIVCMFHNTNTPTTTHTPTKYTHQQHTHTPATTIVTTMWMGE